MDAASADQDGDQAAPAASRAQADTLSARQTRHVCTVVDAASANHGDDGCDQVAPFEFFCVRAVQSQSLSLL